MKLKVISEEHKDIYEYCFELMLSSVFTFALIIFVAWISESVIETVFLLVGFLPLRQAVGGYHAKTHWECICKTVIFYCLLLLLIHYTPGNLYMALGVCYFLLANCLIWIYAPIADANKPINKEDFIRLRKRGRRMLVMLDAASAMLLCFGYQYVVYGIGCGLLAISGLLLSAQLLRLHESTS